jgi:hypothetical protein
MQSVGAQNAVHLKFLICGRGRKDKRLALCCSFRTVRPNLGSSNQEVELAILVAVSEQFGAALARNSESIVR